MLLHRDGKPDADLSISQLLITRPDEIETQAPGPATPDIASSRLPSMARSGFIPGIHCCIGPDTCLHVLTDPQALEASPIFL